jgi:carbamoyl-phosphate synthase large subunit
MATNVLVTCAGSMPGVAVINALKRQNEIPIRVIAVDRNPLSAGFYLSDAHYTLPSNGGPGDTSTVLKICKEENVQIVFPVIDEELPAFAEKKSEFKSHGIRIVSNEPETVRVARDKLETCNFFRGREIRLPATYLPGELSLAKLPNFPLVIKPRFGRGTVGYVKVNDASELAFHINRVPDAIVQEFIAGQEYTIDVLTDFEGRVLSLVPKARLEVKAGMQVKGRTIKDERLFAFARKILAMLPLAPRANIQCIDSGGEITLIEVNPKFSASLPFTIAAGVNAPLLLVKMHLGEKVEPMIGKFAEGLVMLRYWQEVFVPADGKPQ